MLWYIIIQPQRTRVLRAITGRRCPYSGVGEDFLARWPVFFSRKRPWLGNQESKNQFQGAKWIVFLRATNGPLTKFIAKNGFFGSKSEFSVPIKHPLFSSNHVLATTEKSCANKKVPFSQINISVLANFGWFRIFGQKNAYQPNVKTAVSLYFRPGPGLLWLWIIFWWRGRSH